MRIAIYARVSTKDKGQDTENQLVQLREFASKQGWQIVFDSKKFRTRAHSDLVTTNFRLAADKIRLPKLPN
jgi:DNA invertase Pin-like site-specific DNA recombinase